MKSEHFLEKRNNFSGLVKMTFTRKSHTRTSKLGLVHTVRSHDVGEFEKQNSLVSNEFLAEESYVKKGICKHCNQEAFFYRSEYGGFAVFDILGKPWTKHPCFDFDTKNYTTKNNYLSDEVKNIGFITPEITSFIEKRKDILKNLTITQYTKPIKQSIVFNINDEIKIYRIEYSHEMDKYYDFFHASNSTAELAFGVIHIELNYKSSEKIKTKTFDVYLCKNNDGYNFTQIDLYHEAHQVNSSLGSFFQKKEGNYYITIVNLIKLSEYFDKKSKTFPFMGKSELSNIKNIMAKNSLILKKFKDVVLREYLIIQHGRVFKKGRYAISRKMELMIPEHIYLELEKEILIIKNESSINSNPSTLYDFFISAFK